MGETGRYRVLLEKHKQEVEGTLNLMGIHGVSKQDMESSGELSSYDNHPAELGTALFQTEINNALKIHEEHLLKEISDALKRIEDGSYGKCELCQKRIEKQRLLTLPYIRLCINCETAREIKTEDLKRQRPVEELVLDAPVGRKYLNEREDDEYEGMDQFYDLVKYGSSDTPQDMGGYEDYKEYYTNKIDKQGMVEQVENISNEEYKRQLPD
ncbi:MAG: conjugal transfer protein TraR [Clostridium sp.]|mgnify:CR=1 FL=1|nr:conjugal transfer protein TraR [Clostridium sp.]